MVRAVVLEKLEAARGKLTQAACIAKGDYGEKELSTEECRWVREMLQSALDEVLRILEGKQNG